MNSKQILNSVFVNNAVKEIPFNPEWGNGTGYLDNAVSGEYAPKLTAGEVVKTMTFNGRKILIIGTPVGNVAVFDRYTGEENTVIVANMPHTIEQLYDHSGTVDEDTMCRLLGVMSSPATGQVFLNWSPNVGAMIQKLVKTANILAVETQM